MSRLNLTLDQGTLSSLDRYARKHRKALSASARDLLRAGLEREDRKERELRLAKEYAAGRSDAREILRDFEAGQLDLLDD